MKPGRPRLLDDDEAIDSLIRHISRGVAQDIAAVLAGTSARSVARLKAEAKEIARLVARERRRAATKGRRPVLPEPGTDEWRLWQFWQVIREARAFARADAEMTLKAHTRRSWRASLEWLARRYPRQWSRKVAPPELDPDIIPDLNVMHGAAPYEATATDAALPGEPTGDPKAGATPFDGVEDDEE